VNCHFSIIILTFNEEVHLPRLLKSISGLDASVFILDSGSTDNTINIALEQGVTVLVNHFETHPKQWDSALKNFNIQTPWIVCLDADQIVTPELKNQLLQFSDQNNANIDGIYFNRKNYFKGRWIKHGGYYPFYLLKMIRYGKGYSDLNENMDHRFLVPGKTVIWKTGYLLEENLKENRIHFWIAKHNRYSDLVAEEEIERRAKVRTQTIKPKFWGSPDEYRALLKRIWWQLPLYVRPLLYFFYRMIFQRGILDGKEGIIFHFLQAFWFRLIVDIKIDEITQNNFINQRSATRSLSTAKFILKFLFLFFLFYYFNIMFFGLTSPGGYYSPFLANHLNYIQGLRWILLNASTGLLKLLGFSAICNNYRLLVAGKGDIHVVYSCLGLGVCSFFAAAVLSIPKPLKPKIIFICTGIAVIETLNMFRFVLLVLFWTKGDSKIVDHHTIFNLTIYTLVAISLYVWVNNIYKDHKLDAAN
jgi:exosortase/archaeosortase family protein